MLGLVAAHAADASAAAVATSAPASAKPDAAVEEQLQALIGKVKAKLENGARTEAALADELQTFDSILVAHHGEKTDAVADVAWWRAMLYVQVFEDYPKAAELLRQFTAEFPTAKQAANAAQILQQLEAQKAAYDLQASLKPGVQFPDFNEKDINGQPLSVAKFKGKIVLVDFWATWCGPCVAELPNVIAAYEKYHSKGFEVVGISLDESEERLKAFIAEHKMTWPQYFDGKKWQNNVSTKYGVNSIPATYLLDRDGRIIEKDLRGEALVAELEKLLGK